MKLRAAAASTCALLLSASLPHPPGAVARSSSVLSYPIADVWPSAVRFIRVERGYPIREKDEGAGYVLFDFEDGAKSYQGALELVRTSDGEGREATRAVFSLSDLPRHFELMLLEKLAAKLRDDRGPPPPPPPTPRKSKDQAPPPDAGSLPRAPAQKELPR